jgi:hypothetical protein
VDPVGHRKTPTISDQRICLSRRQNRGLITHRSLVLPGVTWFDELTSAQVGSHLKHSTWASGPVEQGSGWCEDAGMSELRRSDPVNNPKPLCGTDWGRLLGDEFAGLLGGAHEAARR